MVSPRNVTGHIAIPLLGICSKELDMGTRTLVQRDSQGAGDRYSVTGIQVYNDPHIVIHNSQRAMTQLSINDEHMDISSCGLHVQWSNIQSEKE